MREHIYKSKLKIVVPFTVILAMLITAGLFYAQKLPAQKKPKMLVHMRTNIKKDDGPPCVGFNMALSGLESGYDVEMLFDMEACYNLKIFEGDGKTDYQRYNVPDDLKQLIKQQYPDFPLDRVKTYQDFLTIYHEMGAKITMNGTWNALTKVENSIKGKEHIIPIAEPLTLDEMTQHFKQADVYLAY
ncbi:MAG: hypothetical protein D6814_01470 [Calditrichaeota bacterium]|nr:MAG: hypothetical protein D6814_01470 [Calditrichota bacterium]